MKSTKELLRTKRDGLPWSNDEMTGFIKGLVAQSVSAPQVAAFLMAACIRGLTPEETAAMTLAMRDSGDKIPPGLSSRPSIDKHSTGGVGDKVSLLLAPLAVSCGLAVPMISGRGLGHTGGTLDKLESVKGLSVQLSLDDMSRLMGEHGLFMAGQTATLVPADRMMYALRDVTGTVENVSLITASILSKKLVENLDGLVMNMTVGSGAFLQTMDAARELAESMQRICKLVGLRVTFVFSSMDRPLGKSVGNWLEVVEADAALAGGGSRDLVEVTFAVATEMLLLSDASLNEAEARARVVHAWNSGAAHQEFHAMLARQGGNWSESVDHYAQCPAVDIVSEHNGYVDDINARDIAIAVMEAGGGRLREDDVIDHAAGVVLLAPMGTKVDAGMVIARTYATSQQQAEKLAADVRTMLQTTTAPVEREPSRILEVWRG